MVHKLIEFSLRNRYIILVFALGLFVWGIFAVQKNPIDAIPDLSENQVIVFTEWEGQSPQIMEDQVTFPLVSNLQGIPKIKTIRGTSMFGKNACIRTVKLRAAATSARGYSCSWA
jgi:Cu/Ag efflux pump CusA